MQRALISFGFMWLVAGCSGSASPPSLPARPAATPSSQPAAAPRVVASGCRAQPSTVYGDEPVVFAVEAPSALRVEVELRDAGGKSVERASLAAPGSFQPANVPSGDFELVVASAGVSCKVTVNRELARATQAKR